MTFDQIALICLLTALFAAFALDRYRIEVVAVIGLFGAFVIGLVPAQSVFSGFAHPAVITVAEILILVGALQASHFVDRAAASLTRNIRSERVLLMTLCLIAGVVSIFMNNIGALALMIPLSTAVSQRSNIPLGRLLMPISFATLLGGTCSLIGTPANLIVSDLLADVRGEGFGFFDFAVVGLPALVAGLAAILLFVPALLPKNTEAGSGLSLDQSGSGRMILEASVPARSPLAGQFLTSVETELDGRIASVRRGAAFVFARREDIRLEPSDALLIEAPDTRLKLALQAGLLTAGTGRATAGEAQHSAVVVPESVILGSRISMLEGFGDLGVRILAITSARKRLEGSFSDIQLAIGDVLHLAGPSDAVSTVIRDYGLISLAPEENGVPLSAGLPPLIAFLAAVALAATGVLRPELSFGAAIAVLAVTGKLDLTGAIRRLNWPILIMLATMIPLGNAVETTGMAELIALSFLNAAPGAGPVFILFAILLTAVIITPFVNNASTAIVLAPIALEIAAGAGIAPEVVLLAVAVGVSIDFVTPFGHHNNTIVMGVGGYRFRDFPIAGLPVLLAVVAAVLLALSMLVK